MMKGKLFELLIKKLLMNVGFKDVMSDGLYIYDGPPGQMIQGLGNVHNADVLLEPPVQTPFYNLSRILVECKNYEKPVGLDILRGALGLREDINNFNIVNKSVMQKRRRGIPAITDTINRYNYQVAVASTNGFTKNAEEFAIVHRIPLIELNKMPFWDSFEGLCKNLDNVQNYEDCISEMVHNFAVAVTNTGQLLFLYGQNMEFDDCYTLTWNFESSLWKLETGNNNFIFELPMSVKENWISHSLNELELRKNAISVKYNELSNMVVYYKHYGMPKIKMISIDKNSLITAMDNLNRNKNK